MGTVKIRLMFWLSIFGLRETGNQETGNSFPLLGLTPVGYSWV